MYFLWKGSGIFCLPVFAAFGMFGQNSRKEICEKLFEKGEGCFCDCFFENHSFQKKTYIAPQKTKMSENSKEFTLEKGKILVYSCVGLRSGSRNDSPWQI